MTDVLLATCSSVPEGEVGGSLLVDALAAHGLSARWVSWDDPGVDWSVPRCVAVRSTWDYQKRLPAYLAWAEHVERWTTLLNGAAAFAWNTDKSYLLDLERAGLPVVPTRLADDQGSLAGVAADLSGATGPAGTRRMVVKPRVGASGEGLVVVEEGPALLEVLQLDAGPTAGHGGWVVQPVVESVRTEGEYSVFVLGGVPVSAVRKLPEGEEVRVHEEYGGRTEAISLTDEIGLLAAEATALGGQLLATELSYARVDLMRWEGRLVVSELEITEPGLYLDVLPGNAESFAAVVADETAGETHRISPAETPSHPRGDLDARGVARGGQ